MKVLKIVGIILLIIIAVPCIIALFISGDVKYEKSITIMAPKEKVWQNVNSLAAMDKWSPWNERDPNMEKKMTGTDGTVGAKSEWNSDQEDVGRGSQTIIEIKAPDMIKTDLKFYDPYESEAQAYVKLEGDSTQTIATWGFTSEIPYPFTISKLFVDIGEQLDPDYQKGLEMLKEICEK